VSDLDDLVRNRRFDEIHEARRQVIDDDKTVAVQPSWRLLKSAFRIANKAVAELGLEIEVTEEQRTEITPDLMQEVEEWRRANL